MAIDIKVPTSGESISQVQVGQWKKADGDAVERDEAIVELETDKASMELPSPESGTLHILKQSGEIVGVGDTIATIEPGGKGQRFEKSKEQKKAEAPAPVKSKAAESRPTSDEPRVMPAARRVMAEKNLRSDQVKATGPGGRILKEDAERATASQPAEDGKITRLAPTAKAAQSSKDGRTEVVPMSMLRRRIAQRLVAAQQTAALLTTFNEIDMTAVLELRQHHGEAFLKKYGVKLGFMSFFIKAAIEALKRVPQVNAEIQGDNIVFKNFYDIGVAVGTEAGLVVPVIRDADRLSFAETEKLLGELAARARDRKLTVDELQGGTFTISNGGVYGSLMSTPIVNPPQSGILGLHAIQERPVAREGQVVIRSMMYVALTYDHRIIDGREAVTFLKLIKEFVESPALMLIEV